MKIFNKISMMLCVASTLLASCAAQVKNAKTETVKIYGNCGMCEKTIETAGNLKKITIVDWNKDTKMAILTYDSTKTNQDEILKRIALAGYDSDKFLAPDDVYNNLHECCLYDRPNKTAIVSESVSKDDSTQKTETELEQSSNTNQLTSIFNAYFEIKDALVNSNGKLASSLATDLQTNIDAVKMEKLSFEEHKMWMKAIKELKANAEKITNTQEIEKQRIAFMDLSKNIYDLMKVSIQDTPVFYQNCPMYNDGKGANWLSKENQIKNPYYGSQMLNCGKTIETIKKK